MFLLLQLVLEFNVFQPNTLHLRVFATVERQVLVHVLRRHIRHVQQTTTSETASATLAKLQLYSQVNSALHPSGVA